MSQVASEMGDKDCHVINTVDVPPSTAISLKHFVACQFYGHLIRAKT